VSNTNENNNENWLSEKHIIGVSTKKEVLTFEETKNKTKIFLIIIHVKW
jgi:hypothetical protein